MYDIKLTKSYFPAQTDAQLLSTTVGDLLRNTAESSPDAIAMVDVDDAGTCGQEWTYRELLEISERLARALSHRFTPGERIVVWAPNIPQWIFLEYACGLAGLVLVTANPSFQAKELRYVLEQSGAVALFLVDEFRGNPMAEVADEATTGNRAIREIVNLQDEAALFAGSDSSNRLPDVEPNNPAQIQYTSGTTGFPKGAVLSHRNLVNNARLYCARKRVGPHSVWANFMPLFHTAGCATGALGCLQAAAKMLLIKRFDAYAFARLIEEADEALRIGLCEYVVPEGQAREKAEQLAKEIARFPQSCVRADRRSVRLQHGHSEREALRQEWWNSKAEVTKGVDGAARFAGGAGRHGDYGKI